MKKCLTVIFCILIAGCFTFYIFDLDDLFKNKPIIGYQENGYEGISVINVTQVYKAQADEIQVLDVTNTTQNTNSAIDESGMLTVSDQTADPIANGWKLVWSDEFDKPNMNLEYWTRMDRKRNYNNELQYYTPANAILEDGCLTLVAKLEDKQGKKYTSAMVDTYSKLSLKYGRIEARMKIPSEQGIFPAMWLLSAESGEEIDIMESVGCEPGIIYGVLHYNRAKKKAYGSTKTETPQEYHVYALEWEKDAIRWYMDGKLYFETSVGVPSEEMYLIINIAVGGDWPGTPDDSTVFPATMAIDYVRIYER